MTGRTRSRTAVIVIGLIVIFLQIKCLLTPSPSPHHEGDLHHPAALVVNRPGGREIGLEPVQPQQFKEKEAHHHTKDEDKAGVEQVKEKEAHHHTKDEDKAGVDLPVGKSKKERKAKPPVADDTDNEDPTLADDGRRKDNRDGAPGTDGDDETEQQREHRRHEEHNKKPTIGNTRRQHGGDGEDGAGEGDEKKEKKKEEPPTYHFTIHVFTYNRLPGLKRLMNSLLNSDYLGHDGLVTLRVFMDFPKKGSEGIKETAETRHYLLSSLKWPYGPLQIHRREINVGLKKSIMEAWYPTTDNEVGAFFEDDVEVSPLWYAWSMAALKKYAPSPTSADSKLLGISLFRPIHDELSGRGCRVKNGNEPFVLQQPCSWGAVYLPRPWRHFRDWYDAHSSEKAEVSDPNDRGVRPTSNTWASKSSWKKYLIKLMYHKGMFMVYPNHKNDEVLSTNHLMKGEHPTPPRKLFELPVLKPELRGTAAVEKLSSKEHSAIFALPPLQTLKAYDIMFRPTKGGTLTSLPNYDTELEEDSVGTE